jgi:hypothetical protein
LATNLKEKIFSVGWLMGGLFYDAFSIAHYIQDQMLQ